MSCRVLTKKGVVFVVTAFFLREIEKKKKELTALFLWEIASCM